jgi:hypothetical protein
LLLVKENKFNQVFEDYEFNNILEKMALFDIGNDLRARREASLIAISNKQVMVLQDELEDISFQRDEISTRSSGLDKASLEYEEVQNKIEQLFAREQLVLENLENFQNNNDNENVTQVFHNEDIVEIPFLRLMAKNDYETVLENAQSFIAEFPSSPIGYYYFIKALIFQGRMDDVARVIEESGLSPVDLSTLLDRVEMSSHNDPKRYWEDLKF